MFLKIYWIFKNLNINSINILIQYFNYIPTEILDFFKKHLQDTIRAINKLKKNNETTVNVRKIRKFYSIKPSNRSQINFIWRTLSYLIKKGEIEANGSKSP